MFPEAYYEFFISFNEGDYYKSHDLLEEIWLTDRSNLFIKGLLQMTVALYHYGYGNVKGTREMLQRAKEYLEPYMPYYWGLDLEPVMQFLKDSLMVIPDGIDRVPYEEIKTLPKLSVLLLNIE